MRKQIDKRIQRGNWRCDDGSINASPLSKQIAQPGEIQRWIVADHAGCEPIVHRHRADQEIDDVDAQERSG